MFQKIKWLIIVLLLIVVVIIGGVLVYADRLTKLAVETAGTQALGVPTTLEKANLSILGGSVSLEGLRVDNPPGYQTEHLLNMGNGTTSVNLGSLRTDTVRVKIIRLENIALTIEQKGLESNLGEVLKNIAKLQKEKPPPDEELSGKKLALERIEIINPIAKVKLLPVPGQVDVMEIELGDITLENISEDRNKAEMTLTVIRKILVSLAEAVVKSGADLPGGLVIALTESVQTVGQTLGEGIIGIAGETEKILQEGVKTIEGVQKGIEEIIKLPGVIFEPNKIIR
ncbi:MAG: hypothetical protein AMJ79_06680 [Phycisphaerae bacterium SM23_30]|nr:MAG: hypothetical protein AMJ79_06680 [Phycisphaerae bacterium SM23_30]